MHPLHKTEDEARGSALVPVAARSRPRVRCEELELHLLNPRGSGTPSLAEAFSVWYGVWTQTLSELSGAKRIFADDFSRQDEIGVVMRGAECIGMVGFRFVDLASPQFREDSYFQSWPGEILDQLAGRWLCVMGNNTIAPQWRGGLVSPPAGASTTDLLSLKEMSVRISLCRFLHGTTAGLIGSPRNDRNLHRVAYDLGARKLAQVEVHGVETDLVIFERADVKPLGPTVDDVWGRRIQHPHRSGDDQGRR